MTLKKSMYYLFASNLHSFFPIIEGEGDCRGKQSKKEEQQQGAGSTNQTTIKDQRMDVTRIMEGENT